MAYRSSLEVEQGEQSRLARVDSFRGGQGGPDLQEFFSVLKLRKWSIILLTLLTMGIALWVSNLQTPMYTSGASILVQPANVGSDAPVTPNLATEEEIVQSVAVAEIVAENLDLELGPPKLLQGLDVESPAETEILHLSYSHSSPAEARRRAQGFADGYLEYRRTTVTEELLRRAEAAQADLKVLQDRLNELEADLNRIPESDARAATLASEASLLQSLILQRQLEQIALPDEVTVGQVVKPAGVPDKPSSPNHVTNLGFGLVAGLGLAIGFAFLRDRFSGRLRSNYELENHLQAPVLGTVPRISAWRKHKEPYLVTRAQWRSPEAEAYRMLRTSVLSATSTGARSILVTSPHSGEGKSATTANLAVAFARAGMKVTVVSADLRRPRIHQFFAAGSDVGLADVLQGRASLNDAIVEVAAPILAGGGHETSGVIRLLPSGSLPEGPAELLGSDAMDKLIAELEVISDVVLIDAPPVLPVTDALVLAPKTSGVLLVVGPRSMAQATVSSTRQQLDQVGAHIFGAVINGPDRDTSQFTYAY